MNETLEKIGINTDERYECIYTTIDGDGNKNSAAIGLKYFGEDDIGCRIFEGSQTLKNIQETKRYVVNITQDPMIFTKSTLDKLPKEYFTDDEDIAILKDAGSYIIVNVVDINEQKAENTPIDNDQSIFMIKGKIEKVVVNDESIKAFNRAFSGIIECLVNVSRYKIVDDEKRAEYMGRVIENDRMISRIGNKQSKEVMELIKKEYEKN
ncbi:DUF447 domain-containing protein [Methanobrevibacter sp.]|uniref:DUF447 domain-containing protein n=1 Tax=Methanobrevibacter sp. TaxID=66852 RepID=UPI0026E0B6B3|nr:DUF447 domain-containing protein [Methanobrevibacter sp.]MDO5859673.1 DUF447 family protein [Methanobrevibacter sp.]